LVNIFKNLSGGVLYHQRSNDYAKSWAEENLANCGIVADYQDKGYETPADYWSAFDGPWREIFTRFWTYVRYFFGETNDPSRPNYWGDPRSSNLFNKPSLHILAADFFRFMYSREMTIDTPEDIDEICGKWLKKIDSRYFDRDWQLDKTGAKKDQLGVTWAKLWDEYSSNPTRLPHSNQYNKLER
jgi:hypothetical protein